MNKIIYVKKYPIILIILALFLSLTAASASALEEWELAGWHYRKAISINSSQVAEDLWNFPVLVDITDPNIGAHAQSDGDDFRFTNYDIDRELPYEIQSYDPSTGHLVAWVRADLTSSYNTKIYLYYGSPSAGSQEDSDNVWKPNYMMVQHLDEASGTHYDSTINHNDGNASVTNQDVSGMIAGADEFSTANSNDSIIIDDAPSIEMDDKFTISAWVKPNSGGENGYGRIVDKDREAYALYMYSSQRFHFNFDWSGHVYSEEDAWVPGQWYHVVATYDRDDAALYVNGNMSGYRNGHNKLPHVTVNDLIIGNNENWTRGFDGVIDEVRISTDRKSAGWVLTEYNNQLDPLSFTSDSPEEIFIVDPIIRNELPEHGAFNVELNPLLSVEVFEPYADELDIEFSTNAGGTWHTIGSYRGSSGTYTQTTTNMNHEGTSYDWAVKVRSVGSYQWVEKKFTLVIESASSSIAISGGSPDRIGVDADPVLSVDISNSPHENLIVQFWVNIDDHWMLIGSQNGGNGVYEQETASIDAINMPAQEYKWRASVFDGSTWKHKLFKFAINGFKEKWGYHTYGKTFIGPLSVDIDNDGIYEVFTTSKNKVTCFDGATGQVRWLYQYNSPNDHAPFEIKDLNNDGIEELVVASGDYTIALHADDGSEYWKVPVPSQDKHLAIVDIEGYGYPYIYTSTTDIYNSELGKGRLRKLNGTTGEVLEEVFTWKPCWGGVSVADADGDGHFEIYVTDRSWTFADEHYMVPGDRFLAKGMQAYDADDLSLLWKYRGATVSSQTMAIADINNDGILDGVAMGQSEYSICVIDGATGNDMHGKCKKNIGAEAHSSISMHDIDGDGNYEISTSRYGSNAQIWEIRADGERTLEKQFSGSYVEPPKMVDVWGDSKLELVAPENRTKAIRIFNNSYDWVDTIDSEAIASTLVQDIDDDGLNELIVISEDGWVRVFETAAYTPEQRVRTNTLYYSERNLGAGVYIPPPGAPHPIIKDVSVKDGKKSVEKNPLLSAWIIDFHYDLMDIKISTNASGEWVDVLSVQDAGNGWYNFTPDNMDEFGTTYYWRVTASDPGADNLITVKTYSFTIYEPTTFVQGWKYRKPIIIDHDKVASDEDDFPVLIDLTDSRIAKIAQENGNDIIFADKSGAKLDYELVSYESKTGHIIAWVKADITAEQNTVLYIYYGNEEAGIQENAEEVWNDYSMVHHLDEKSGIHYDATSNHNDGVPSVANQDAVGIIGGADEFSRRSEFNNITINHSDSLNLDYGMTISAWIYPDSYGIAGMGRIFDKRTSDGYGFYMLSKKGTITFNGFNSTYPDMANNYNLYNQSYAWANSMSTDEWHHVAVTYDAEYVSFSIDGIPRGSFKRKYKVNHNGTYEWDIYNIKSNEADLILGNRHAGNRTFDGILDEIRISNKFRSNGWFTTEYNNQIDPASFYRLGDEEEKLWDLYSDFDEVDSSEDLRENSPGPDWYESRNEKPEMLTLDESEVGGDISKKAKISASTESGKDTYLSYSLKSPVSGRFSVQWEVYVDEIKKVGKWPDRSVWMMLGDDGSSGACGADYDRFSQLAFLKEGGGTNGTMHLIARDRNHSWGNHTILVANMSLDQWYTIKIVADMETDTYDVYVDGELAVSNIAALTGKSQISHVCFAQMYDGAGTFYIDNVMSPAEDRHILNMTTSGSGSVSLSKVERTYAGGTKINISAFPDAGWKFIGWSGDFTGENDLSEIVIDGSMDITAHFLPENESGFTLTVNVDGAGHVLRDPYFSSYANGTLIDLNAAADDEWMFTEWSGDTYALSGDGTDVNITIESDINITAHFLPIIELQRTLDVTVMGNGTVFKNPDKEVYIRGSTVELNASAAQNWSFSHWSLDLWSGDVYSEDEIINLTIENNTHIVAFFKPDFQINYTFNMSLEGNGTVMISDSNNPFVLTPGNPDYASVYPFGSSIALNIAAAPDCEFLGWSGDMEGLDESLNIIIYGDMDITAVFERIAYLTDSDFEASDNSSDLRENTYRRDWYESRNQKPQLLELDEENIAGNIGKKAKLKQSESGNAYLTQEFRKPLDKIFTADWQIYVDSILNLSDYPDRAGIMMIGDDTANNTRGPNFGDEENFVWLAFYKDEGGTNGTMDLIARGRDGIKVTVEPDLNLKQWYNITVIGDVESDMYDVYVDGQIRKTGISSLTPKDNLTHISFAQWNDGAGTFYIDNAYADPADLYKLSIVNDGGGNVSKDHGGTFYTNGTIVNLGAAPLDGWAFDYWLGNFVLWDAANNTVIEDSSAVWLENITNITVKMDRSSTIIANFIKLHNLSVNVTGNGSVSISPDNSTYRNGTIVELTATAASNWTFWHWGDNLSNTNESINITMDDDKQIMAYFMPDFPTAYNLSMNIDGHGSVSISPVLSNYSYGTQVELHAIADFGWEFVGWSGDYIDEDELTNISVNSNMNITALFEEIIYLIDTQFDDSSNSSDLRDNSSGIGWYESRNDNQSLLLLDETNVSGNMGKKAMLEGSMQGNAYLTQEFGRPFSEIFSVEWDIYVESILDINGSDFAGIMMLGDDKYKDSKGPNSWDAENFVWMAFYRDENGTMDLKAKDRGGSTISIAQGLNLGQWYNIKIIGDLAVGSYDVYVDGGLKAASVMSRKEKNNLTHISFAQWNDGAGTFYVDNVSASGKDFYRLNMEINGVGTISKYPDRTVYPKGVNVAINATPEDSWEFDYWSGDIANTSEANIEVMFDSNKNITANFIKLYNLTVTMTGNGAVSVSPDNPTYRNGTIVELTAVAGENWNFSHWGDNFSNTDEIINIAMDADKEMIAHFMPAWNRTYEINVSIAGNGSVFKNPLGPYSYGETVELTASPAWGYWEFIQWSGDITSRDEKINVTMYDDMMITAVFDEISYIVDSRFDYSFDSSDLRDNEFYQDWYESRNDNQSLLELDEDDISGNTGKKAKLIGSLDENAYLTQEFRDPLAGTFAAEWDIYVDSILDRRGSDFAGIIMIGDDINNDSGSPNYGDAENFAMLAFFKEGGGTSGGMDLKAKEAGTGWRTIASGLNMKQWHNLKIRSCLESDIYDVYVNGILVDAGARARTDKDSLTHISFAQWSDAAGTFYVDDVRVSSEAFNRLDMAVNGSGTILKNPDGTFYSLGDLVYLTPSPNEGWNFSYWSGDINGTQPNMNVTINGDIEIIAHFVDRNYQYSLDVNIVGNGSVSKNLSLAKYINGTPVELNASPGTGWEFLGWSGEVQSINETVNITMDYHKRVTAYFVEQNMSDYKLFTDVFGDGYVTANPINNVSNNTNSSNSTDMIELNATAAPGWRFDHWSSQIGNISGNETINITLDAHKIIIAHFVNITPIYTLKVTSAGHGTAAWSPHKQYYINGSTVTLTVKPDNGYNFGCWSGDIYSKSSVKSIVMTSNMEVVANFNKKSSDGGSSGGGSSNKRSKSGGGGGGSSVRIEPIPFNDNGVADFNAKKSTIYRFKVDDEPHSFNIDRLTATGMDFKLKSKLITASLLIGKSDVFDLNGDGTDDIRLKLNSVDLKASQASLTMYILSIAGDAGQTSKGLNLSAKEIEELKKELFGNPTENADDTVIVELSDSNDPDVSEQEVNNQEVKGNPFKKITGLFISPIRSNVGSLWIPFFILLGLCLFILSFYVQSKKTT